MYRLAWIAGLLLSVAMCGAIQDASAQDSHPQFEIWKNGTRIAGPETNPDALKRVIVEFKHLPLLEVAKNSAKQASAFTIAQDHDRLADDLQNLRDKNLRDKNLPGTSAGKLAAQTSPAPHISHNFKQAFNGAAVTMPLWMIRHVQALDYVKEVHLDGEMIAMAIESPKSNNASVISDPSQTGLRLTGGTGVGVRVAVIDTGIDYTHPALGGGLGEGFKVIDGYNFVSDHADPMDDNGHGTHVAGIIAGINVDSTWQGVAPDAQLLAYKVLDEDGSGRDTWVLAAIERALDPDGSPATDDAVDIINLSLGSGAGSDSNHPVTLAVERAVKAGIVCVVAAGNSGHLGAASIAAPGNALAAITVGAASTDGDIASFSAQGPTGSIKANSLPRFAMKPDVFAPGEGVYSTWLDNGFKAMDGTSMATPHIAGLVAGMLELNQSWSPAQVKAAIALMADQDGFLPWLVGESQTPVVSARTVQALATPARFDFGLVDLVDDTWRRQDTLTIHNFDDVAKTYGLQINGDLPAAVVIDFVQPTITVGPNTSQTVPFTISAPVDAIPRKDFPDAYEGMIHLESNTETFQIPFSFFHPAQSRLVLDEPADVLFIHGKQNEEAFSFFDVSGDLFLFLPEDQYDAIAQFESGNRVVIKENVFENGALQTTIISEDADLTLHLDVRDLGGRPLQHLSGMHAITHKETGYAIVRRGGFLSMASQLPAIQHFSTFSDAYKVEIKATGFSADGGYYELPFSVEEGMSSDIQFRNEADEMTQIKYHYSVPDATTQAFFVPWSYDASYGQERATISAKLDVNPGSPFILHPPFEQTVFLLPPPNETFRWKSHFHTLHSDAFSLFNLATNARKITLLATEEVDVIDDENVRIGGKDGIAYPSNEPITLYPGMGLMHWAGQLDNGAHTVKIKEAPAGGFYLNAWNDLAPRAFAYKLYEGVDLIAADSVYNVPNLPVARWLGETEIDVTPGAYTLVMDDVHTSLQGWKSRATATLSFKTDLADANPPRITQLYIDSDGKPGRILHPERTHTIVLGVTDVCSWCDEGNAPSSLSVMIRAANDSTWITLNAEASGGTYKAVLPSGLDEAFYDLRVDAADISGNETSLTVSPAFELGTSAVPLPLEPLLAAQGVSLTPTISWQPVTQAISYHVQFAEDPFFEMLIDEKADLEMTQLEVGVLTLGKRYFWRVRANTVAGDMPWSQPFWFDTMLQVSAQEGNKIPDAYALEEIYPNPVISLATLQYSLPNPGVVQIELFDMLGRRIEMIESTIKPAGIYQEHLNTTTLAPGAYFVRLQAGSFVKTKKFVKQ